MPARAWAGSTRRSRLPGDWNSRRQRILTRDGHRCQIHGPACTVTATEVDHINPGDDHSPRNLQAVCAPCHKAKTALEAASARPRTRRAAERHPGLL